MRRATSTAGKARLSELLVWDAVLVGVVGALVAADHSLPARAAQPVSVAPPQQPTPPPSPSPQPGERPIPRPRETPPKGPRRAGQDTGALAAAEKSAREHLAAGRLEEAVAALQGVPAALKGSREHDELVRAIRAGVVERAELVAALPRLQACMDAGKVAGLDTEISGLPRGAEKDQLVRELDVARKRPSRPAPGGSGFQVREFRPGWTTTRGKRAVIQSALPPADARALVDSLEGVMALANELASAGPGPHPELLEVWVLDPDGTSSGPAACTWRRTGEDAAALQARARWAMALRLAETLNLARAAPWVASGLPAVLATAGASGGAKPSTTAAGRALRSRFLLEPPRGDGTDLAALLQGSAPDPVRAWAVVAFASAADPSAAPLRAALERALGGVGGPPPALASSEAAALERAWIAWLERP